MLWEALMQQVTAGWLHERGGLHDAWVIDVQFEGAVAKIQFDDEWANERGLSRPEGQESPGTLVLDGLSTARDDLLALSGGWVSYIELRGDELDLAFCDRPQIYIRIGSACWHSAD